MATLMGDRGNAVEDSNSDIGLLNSEILDSVFNTLLEKIFDTTLYIKSQDNCTFEKDDCIEHFKSNTSPESFFINPFIDARLLKSKLQEAYPESYDTSFTNYQIIRFWFETDALETVPWESFDTDFYLQQYPDVKSSDMQPFLHFLLHGAREGRFPSRKVMHCVSDWGINENHADLYAFFRYIPAEFHDDILDPDFVKIFTSLIHREFYITIRSLNQNIHDIDLLMDYLTKGLECNTRPSLAFHEKFYRSLWTVFSQADQYILKDEDEYDRKTLRISPFIHWMVKGRKANLIPTPLLDLDIYRSENRDLSKFSDSQLFRHFVQYGAFEDFRKFSNFFDTFYIKKQLKVKKIKPLLDYVLYHQFRDIGTHEDYDHTVLRNQDGFNSSPAEEIACLVKEKTLKLHYGKSASLIARAQKLEPQIVRPYGRRRTRLAPVFHPEVKTFKAITLIEDRIRSVCNQVDDIIFVPHCRMAGSARIAGELSKAIAALKPSSNAVIITTDASYFEKPEWFNDTTSVIDISDVIQAFEDIKKAYILMDVIRGIQPTRVFNVNSRAAWCMTKTYGKQISSWTDLFTYLFCWDLDSFGNKGGYPIQWFLPSFNYLKGVITDSSALRSELIQRYSLTGALAEKIQCLYTPVEPVEACWNDSGKIVDSGRRPRCFWSGRFDRQKRFDILIDVAARNTNVDFYAWGKRVLNDLAWAETDIPENMYLMGEYQQIDDIPLSGFDFYLYTSEWDGLPTVILEVGIRGFPIIAGNAGGISEVIDEKSGWLVNDCLDAEAYSQAIQDLLSSDTTAEKTSVLRQRILEMTDKKLYAAKLSKLLTLQD